MTISEISEKTKLPISLIIILSGGLIGAIIYAKTLEAKVSLHETVDNNREIQTRAEISELKNDVKTMSENIIAIKTGLEMKGIIKK